MGLGGGIWDDVAERLRRAGHRVFTRTLSGVGERCHLANPALGFDTHAVDLANAIDFEDLRDSYTGLPGFFRSLIDLPCDRMVMITAPEVVARAFAAVVT